MIIMQSRKEETRKVQFTGKSTFIISLPKKWVDKVKLEQGERVQVVEQNDLSLLILPKEIKKEVKPNKIDIREYL
jgi:phosphate uptake regulator